MTLRRKQNVLTRFNNYRDSNTVNPLFIRGDSLLMLRKLPDESIDCIVTSPPYWGHREYEGGGIGSEETWQDYVQNLRSLSFELRRVLKDCGSLWLNLGDTYNNKKLLGLPWRVAFDMIDTHDWCLRNDVIWNKSKGVLDSSVDKLTNVHEHIFHFVKNPKDYYYNVDGIRSKQRNTYQVASSSSSKGDKYKRQIELSTELSKSEKTRAIVALDDVLDQFHSRKLYDFRMIIRGEQRVTHSESGSISGRVHDLRNDGYYFIKSNPKGGKPTDVWSLPPETSRNRKIHYAAYPESLCKIPIIATCPKGGIVLDPFSGTGTTLLAAKRFGLKSVGIDISKVYIAMAKVRCSQCAMYLM